MANALKNFLMSMSNPQTTSSMIDRQRQLALNRRLAQQRRERLGLEERRQDWAEGGDAEIRRMNARNYAGRTDAQNRRTALQEDRFGFQKQKYNEAPERAAVMGGIRTMTGSPEGIANLPTQDLGDPDAFKLAAPKMLSGQVRQRSRVAGAETNARESAKTQAMIERKDAGLGVDARTLANIRSREELAAQKAEENRRKNAIDTAVKLMAKYQAGPQMRQLAEQLVMTDLATGMSDEELAEMINQILGPEASREDKFNFFESIRPTE